MDLQTSNIEYKVNLLPYRTMRKLANGKRYAAFLGIFAASALGLSLLVYLFFTIKLSIQDVRNNYLQSEIQIVTGQIKEIEKLKEDINQLLARKLVVESLQVNRGRTIALLNFLVSNTDGIYFSNIKQNGDNISIQGIAKTQEHVAILMQKIQQSNVLKEPRLVEAVSTMVQNEKMSQFTINSSFFQVTVKAEETKKDAKSKTTGKK